IPSGVEGSRCASFKVSSRDPSTSARDDDWVDTCGAFGASLYQRSQTGRFRSGQTGQTVNLLALRLRWFESSPAHFSFETGVYRRLPRDRDFERPEERDLPRDDVDLARLFAPPLRDRPALDRPRALLRAF